tara:strand:+ start:3365 stop:3760 length:396 start_codon:yes stop_codon:yes gene_type:complete
MEHISLIISSAIASLILFQSLIVAPYINGLLKKEDASVFLRVIWPKFFVMIGTLGLLGFGAEILNSEMLFSFFFLSGSLMMLLCYLITASINKAKDNSKLSLWKLLHSLTIILTLAVLILNLLFIYLRCIR